jgi:hypothetical protein
MTRRLEQGEREAAVLIKALRAWRSDYREDGQPEDRSAAHDRRAARLVRAIDAMERAMGATDGTS